MKHLYLLLIALASGMGFLSCDDENSDLLNNYALEIDQESIAAGHEGNATTVTVTCKGMWSATSDVGWCQIDKNLAASDGAFQVIVEPYDGFLTRTANIKVSTGADRIVKYIQVMQAPKAYVLPETIDIGKITGQYEIILITESAWTAQIVEKGFGTDWIQVSPASGEKSSQITLNFATNESSDQKTAILRLAYNGQTKDILITQSDVFETPVIEFEETATTCNVKWNTILGAAGYGIVVFDENGTEKASVEVGGGVTSYNMADFPSFIAGAENFYTGKVQVAVKALTSVPDNYSESEKSAVFHSHYDLTSGDGTDEAKAFVLTTPRHLNNVRQNLGGTFIQKADIDLAGLDDDGNSANGNFVPVRGFKGMFDGGGNVIAHMKISTNVMDVGLFGSVVDAGSLKNIRLVLPEVECTIENKDNNIGVLVGSYLSTRSITNCHTIDGKVSGYGNNVGGLIGKFASESNQSATTLENSSNQSTTVQSVALKSAATGGLIGLQGKGIIENCYNTGSISGYLQVGGITGGVGKGGKIYQCYNAGTIENLSDASAPTDQIMAGGITARLYSSVAGEGPGAEIRQCYNTGNVRCAYYMGGIAGKLGIGTLTISDCYNTGTLTVTAIVQVGTKVYTNVGGISSTINVAANVITNCYVTGAIDSSIGSGAIIGAIMGDVANLTAGSNKGVKFENVFCLSTVAPAVGKSDATGYAQGLLSGAAKSEVELKGQNTFTGWDFSTIWDITDGSYPTLK